MLFDRTRIHGRAAEVYRMAIAVTAGTGKSRLQDRVVVAMERLRNFEQALRERNNADLCRGQRVGQAEPRQRRRAG